MTREEILNMPAGREMDLMVANKVFGAVPCKKWFAQHYTERGAIWMAIGSCEHEKCYPENSPPKYSTDIAAAWEVIEKFDNRCMLNFVHTQWECYLPNNAKGESKSAPLAICRAALLAIMEEYA